uniref:HDAC_interact domain-containing protein n=1 Tax=Strongyloides papillosus TaxID=174720 RepID=A0A0N5BW64_STREA
MFLPNKGRKKHSQVFDYFCNWSDEGIDKMLNMLMQDITSTDVHEKLGYFSVPDDNIDQFFDNIRHSQRKEDSYSNIDPSTVQQIEFFKRVAVSEYIDTKQLQKLPRPDEFFQLTEEDFVKRIDATKDSMNKIPFPEKYINNLKDACCKACGSFTNDNEKETKILDNMIDLSRKQQDLNTHDTIIQHLDKHQLQRGFKYYNTPGVKKQYQFYKSKEEIDLEAIEFFIRLDFDKIMTKMEISRVRDSITPINSCNTNGIDIHRLSFDKFYELAKDPKNTVESLKKEGKIIDDAFLTYLNSQYILCRKHGYDFSVDPSKALTKYFRDNIVPAVYDNVNDWFIETVLLIKGIILLNEEVELEHKLSWYEYIFIGQRSYQLAAIKYKLLCDGKDEAPPSFTDAIDAIIDRYVKENSSDDSMVKCKPVKGDPLVHQFIREVDRDILKLGATAIAYPFNEENLRLRQFPKEILFLRKIKGLEQFRIAKLKGSKCNISKPNIRKKVNREMKSSYASVRDSFNALSNKEFEAPQHYLDAVDMLADQFKNIFSKIHHSRLQIYLAHLITNLEMISIKFVLEDKSSKFYLLEEILRDTEYTDGRLTRNSIVHPVWLTELSKNIGILDKSGNKIQFPEFEREVNIQRIAFNLREVLSSFEMFPRELNSLSDSEHDESDTESEDTDIFEDALPENFQLSEDRLKQLGLLNEVISKNSVEEKCSIEEKTFEESQQESNDALQKPTTSKDNEDGICMSNNKVMPTHESTKQISVNDIAPVFDCQLQKACCSVDKSSLKDLLQICKKGNEIRELSMQDVSCIDKIMGQIVMNFISQTEECDNISDEVLKQKIAHLANLFEKDPTELHNISELAFRKAKQVKDEHEFKTKMKVNNKRNLHINNRVTNIENYIKGQLGFHASIKCDKLSTSHDVQPKIFESCNLMKQKKQSSNTSSFEELSSSIQLTASNNSTEECKGDEKKSTNIQTLPPLTNCKPSTSKESPPSTFIDDVVYKNDNLNYLLQQCVKNRRQPNNEEREFYCLPSSCKMPPLINQALGQCPEISRYTSAAILFTEKITSKEKQIIYKNDKSLINKLEEIYKPRNKGIPDKYREEVERIFALTEQKKVFDHLNSFN